MTFQPLELRPDQQAFSLINLVDNGIDQVLVLHRLLVGVEPSVSPPIREPFSDTLDGVVAVRIDCDVSISWRNINGTLDCGELSTLIGLTRSDDCFG